MLDLTVVSTGAGATASNAGCAGEEEEDASADLLEEKGQTMMARYVRGYDVLRRSESCPEMSILERSQMVVFARSEWSACYKRSSLRRVEQKEDDIDDDDDEGERDRVWRKLRPGIESCSLSHC